MASVRNLHQLLRIISIFTLLPIVFLYSQTLRAGHPVLFESFKLASGETIQLNAHLKSVSPAKPTLLLFWAAWCLPCKDELKTVIDQPRLTENFTVIAVNVDESSQWTKAQFFLSEIKWSKLALFDERGNFFYRSNPSGQLPYSMILDTDGNLLQSDQEFDLTKLNDLNVAVKENAAPWTFSANTKFRELDNLMGKLQSAAVGSSRLTWSKSEWEVSAEYQILYQKNDASINQNKNWEDQLGHSYLEWRTETSRIHLGDAPVSWLKGELIYLQEVNNSTNPSLLSGLGTFYKINQWQFSALVGKIKTPLFSHEIDPTKDSSITLPHEKLTAAQAVFSPTPSEDSTKKWTITAAAAQYKMDSNIDLGYPQVQEDQRWGLGTYIVAEDRGLDVNFSNYSILSPEQATDRVRSPHQWDAQIWFKWGDVNIPITFVESQNLPQRALQLTLVESPAIPLDGRLKTQWKIQPRISVNSHINIEPGFVNEDIQDQNNPSRQKTYSLNVTDEAKKLKMQSVLQLSELDISSSSATDGAVLIGGPLPYELTIQGLWKRHTGSLSGFSQNYVLGIPLNLLNWNVSQLALNLQLTQQDQYYRGQSGIDRSQLWATELLWKNKSWSARLAHGTAPGGTVCANGICTQVAPLSGWHFDLSYSAQF